MVRGFMYAGAKRVVASYWGGFPAAALTIRRRACFDSGTEAMVGS